MMVLMPIINQYMILGWTFTMLFSALGIVLLIFNYHKCAKRHIWYGVLAYLFYVTLSLLAHAIILDTGLATLLLRLLNLTFTIVHFFVVAPVLFDYEYGYEFYTKVVIVLSIIILVQYIQFFISGRATKLIIPGVALNYNNISDSSELISNALKRAQSSNYFRPSSLFLEPAYFAQYVLPWLYLTLSKGYTNGKMAIIAAFVTLPTLLTASSLAIGGSVIIWVIFGLKLASDTKNRFNYGAFFAIVFILFIVWYAMNDVTVQTSLLIKLRSLYAIEFKSSSLSVRLLRGWECFKQFKPLDKIFGCGYGNVSHYLSVNHIFTIYDTNMGDLSYMNGISTMVCSLGIVGTLVYIHFFIVGIFKAGRQSRYLILIWVILMLTTAVYDSAIYFLILVFALVDERSVPAEE